MKNVRVWFPSQPSFEVCPELFLIFKHAHQQLVWQCYMASLWSWSTVAACKSVVSLPGRSKHGCFPKKGSWSLQKGSSWWIGLESLVVKFKMCEGSWLTAEAVTRSWPPFWRKKIPDIKCCQPTLLTHPLFPEMKSESYNFFSGTLLIFN